MVILIFLLVNEDEQALVGYDYSQSKQLKMADESPFKNISSLTGE